VVGRAAAAGRRSDRAAHGGAFGRSVWAARARGAARAGRSRAPLTSVTEVEQLKEVVAMSDVVTVRW